MRLVALALCASSVSGLELRGAPAAAPAGPGGPGGPGRYNEAEYAADWHSEWSHGDYPNYKETYQNSKAVSQYTDRQSDGKASKAYGLMQADPPAAAPAGPGGPGGPGRYNEAEYAADWHSEWSHGDYPNYKETYQNSKAVSQYTDRQSDGKASKAYGLMQADPPAAAPAGPGGPGGPGRYNEAEYAADWHSEWSHGDYPNYKETYQNSKAVSQYTDRQSDGKASKAYGLVQNAAAPAAAPAGPGGPGGPGRYNEAEYAADWHTEWSHGDFPNYKETYSNNKAVSQYTDRQSDGKASKAYGF